MNDRMNLPRCSGIDPDHDFGTGGYYCKNCGGELIARGTWWRHGTKWVHPEVWMQPDKKRGGLS